MRFFYQYLLHLIWILIPALSIYFILVFRRKRKLLHRFGDPLIMEKMTAGVRRTVIRSKPVLLVLAVLFLVIVLARPQFGIKEEELKREGVDILVALDTSLSMDAQDVQPSRLLKAKNEITRLIDMLEGDRIGLIAFAGDSFVQCPLTLDYGAARLFLDIIDTGIIPTPGTSLTSAIKTASNAFSKKERKYKVLILFTDGEGHQGNPIETVQNAAEEGIRIYCVGMGSPKGEPIPVLDKSGKKTGYKKDSKGNVVMSQLDEATLQKIALMSGGRYYRATPEESGLEAIYKDIRKMEKKELSSRQFTQYEDRYQIFLAVALVLLFIEAFLMGTKKDIQRSPDNPGRNVLHRNQMKLLHINVILLCFLLVGWDNPFSRTLSKKTREGNKYYKQNQLDKALKAYTEAQLAKPDAAELHFNIGDVLYKQKKYPEALAEYQKVIADERDDLKAKAYYNIGNSFFKSNHYDQAVNSYKKSLELNPDDKDAKINLELAQTKLEQQQQQQNQQDKKEQEEKQKRPWKKEIRED